MKKVMFLSDISTKFNVLIDVAQFLRKSNNYAPVFYFDDQHNDINNEPDICKEKKIPFFFSYRSKLNPQRQHLSTYKNQIKEAEIFLKENKINVLVNCEDNFGISLIFIKASKNIGIPSVIIPFTLANHEEIGFAFKNEKHMYISNLYDRVFFSFFRKFMIKYDDKYFSYLKPRDILSQKFAGVLPQNPYISVGGNSEYKLFESQFMLDYYTKSGFVSNKNTCVVGSLKFDVFFDLTKNKLHEKFFLLEQLKLDKNKPIILCSLIPDYYPTPLYKNHREIIEHWLRVLTAVPSHHILISLHPRMKLEDLFYIKNYNISVVNKPIEYLIPLCDIFVASLSATIRYALACNKPVVNFDTVKVGYSEYKGIDQVKTVYTKDDFESAIRQVSKTPLSGSIYNEYFGKLDGKSNERIMQFFDNI